MFQLTDPTLSFVKIGFEKRATTGKVSLLNRSY